MTGTPWGIILIMLPLAGGMICFLWPRVSTVLGLLTSLAVAVSVAGLGWQLQEYGVY